MTYNKLETCVGMCASIYTQQTRKQRNRYNITRTCGHDKFLKSWIEEQDNMYAKDIYMYITPAKLAISIE